MITIKHQPLVAYPFSETPAYRRSNLAGEQEYPALIKRLEAELTKLKATGVFIGSFHRPEDIRLDGHLRAGAKNPANPAIILRFTSGVLAAWNSLYSDLIFHCDQYKTWQDNLRAIVTALELVRRLEATLPSGNPIGVYSKFKDDGVRWASATGQAKSSNKNWREEWREEWQSRSSSSSSSAGSSRRSASGSTKQSAPQETVEVRAARCLLREAGGDISLAQSIVADIVALKKVYIAACKNAHPDTGGTNERMRAVNAAWAVLNKK